MNGSLRIAVVGACPFPVPQGSQVYLRETALALQRAGHDVRLVVYGFGVGEDSSGLRTVRGPALGRRTRSGPSLAKPLLDLALVNTLRRVCREDAIDAVSAHNYEGLAIAIAAGLRPILYHAHNAMADELPSYFNAAPGAATVGAWLDRTLPRRADFCVVPHARLAEYLIACGCDSSKVVVVPPAISPVVESKSAVKDDVPTVLYTGNLDAYQNLTLLAEAMPRVLAEVSAARLTLVTSDSTEGTCLSGKPWVDHVPSSDPNTLASALQRDSVVVCPRVSWSGYPMKLLNAMAAGRPIVCCESSAHPLKPNLDALVVPDDDAVALADAVIRLLRDAQLREQLGASARRSHQRNHRPESFAVHLDEVYRAALDGKTHVTARVL